ncbi:MAG: LysR family transcriptional regulator [Novosphingobium sp.]
MIDPRALRTYLAVCREGSISAAARRLGISQPSVSVAIAQLERAIGAILFDRTHAGVVLSPEGHALRRRAHALEALLRDAEEEIALVKAGARGPLRVGGTPGALVSLLPDAIGRFERMHGPFALHVLERGDRDLVGMLRKGEIELAIVTTGIEEPPEDIAEESFGEDPFALIAGRTNAHLPDAVSLTDVIAMAWVLPEAQGAFRRQVDALFLAADVPSPLEVIRCDSLLTTRAIVRDSARVTILPHGVIADDLAVGTLRSIRIVDAAFTRRIGARWMRSGHLSQAAVDMLDALRSQA